MKKFLTGAAAALFVVLSACSGPRESALWNDANEAYRVGDYASAAVLYDSIERSGTASAALYFNKGNALFKMGKTGPAILYFAKAQRLSPLDPDVRHNLAVASAQTRNRIEPVPELFLRRWVRGLAGVLGAGGWAVCVLVFLGLSLAGALAFLLPVPRLWRRVGLYGGVASVMLLAMSFGFAQSAYNEAVSPSGGVVLSPQAAVKSSPDSAGTDLFVLYEGDRVRVLDRLGEWSEISVANGNRGWIRTATFSLID